MTQDKIVRGGHRTLSKFNNQQRRKGKGLLFNHLSVEVVTYS